MDLHLPFGLGEVSLSLLGGEVLLRNAAGVAAGLALQRIADPGATRGAWLRAAPWLAGVALLLSLEVGTPTSHRPGVSLAEVVPAGLVLMPPAAVALVQIAAAVAGRGRRAPLVGAAPWARLALFVPAIAWAYDALGERPPVRALTCVLAVVAAGLVALARRPPLPGASLPIVGVVAVTWVGADLEMLSYPDAAHRALVAAQVAIEAIGPVAVAIALRRLRIDRSALEALGVDAGAPAELVTTYFGLLMLVVFASMWLVRSSQSDGEFLLEFFAALVAGWLACTAAFLLALRYLRRRLDEAEGRKAARAAPGEAAP